VAFKDLKPAQKIVAVNTDFMRHPNFAILGGVTQIGEVRFDNEAIPTAGTDGEHVYYNEAFIAPMTRKQLRYLVGHEALHKALHHCTAYMHIKKQYPQEFAMAIDYVVNWQLESMDTDTEKFLERPTNVPPLIDNKYANMSVPEVVRKLLQQKQQGGGQGQGQPMDTHMDGEVLPAGEGNTEAEAAGKDLKTRIEDAVAQGKIVSERLHQMRGTAAGGGALSGFVERRTDWRGPLRKFIADICEGDDQSRYAPPNKRLLPLDVLLPSRFSEATGELIVACDTSASMHGLYPVVFGEIARICQQMTPQSVRVLWWDTEVAGEQVFTAKDYANISKLMAPRGGGGTTVSCVAQHIRNKRYKPKAVIILTDGYLEARYDTPNGNLLWGVCGNSNFRPLRGKLLQIEET
jgi:predicted metal-dependent peptidase